MASFRASRSPSPTRGSAATVTGNVGPTSVNERILRACQDLYTDPDEGLVAIGQTLGLSLLTPRKKITVLLIGNHSAGKSSFINWYIEEHVQRTGVAIETQGFSLVTSGKKRETLLGNATLHLYPQFAPLGEINGVLGYLSTEISTSKQKKFPLVTFVDTPGLVDGDMKYPFDVNKTLLWLGDMSDLIFVFFDPIGQALCKRTLNIVERLNAKHSDRIRFFLSKADEAGHEADRQRVMMQIVQELCKRPGLNKQGFDMPTIYIPDANKNTRCVNQIEEVCLAIERTIDRTVQNTLDQVERDCSRLSTLIKDTLERDNAARALNTKTSIKGVSFLFLSALIPLLVLSEAVTHGFLRSTAEKLLGKTYLDVAQIYTAPLAALVSLVPDSYIVYFYAGVVLLTLGLYLMFRWGRKRPTLARRRRNELAQRKKYLDEHVLKTKQSLYQEYLHQSVSDHDL